MVIYCSKTRTAVIVTTGVPVGNLILTALQEQKLNLHLSAVHVVMLQNLTAIYENNDNNSSNNNNNNNNNNNSSSSISLFIVSNRHLQPTYRVENCPNI